ncbi:hypothetical protein B0H66DRAFT_232297 [Apodospora peruviana]|uniref:Meiotically up-regulated gene 154 protein n=1 Tax=Apodospora peruviana TaxID=516989 RepID=A0AAE0I470_9PEZI|nr:hypothetical protein B0H66DRAFT_232297 [Apodospora peruviana]
MPPRPPRLVRRRPWSERIQAMLNPLDLYLSLSEEVQTLDWDSKKFGTQFGLAANFIFLLARANSGDREAVDDVFSDSPSNGWVTVLVQFLVWTLIPISIMNAFYTMTRSRHYRLFEENVEAPGPSTPSAHRVRVDSLPASSSPLRLVRDILQSESAEARAHPDKTRDVWEITVWDPYPATLRILCLFSPGHVLIYTLFLPLTSLESRPSVTVVKCLLLQIILSAQLLLMHSRFSQQARDTAIIQKEVMREYDIKYVHPRLHPVVREIATQVSIGNEGIEEESVSVGTPTTIIRRGFQTHPNANYVKHIDLNAGRPQSQPQLQPQLPRNVMSPGLFTPSAKPRMSDVSMSTQVSRPSGLRQSLPPQSQQPPPGFGGSLGVYSHMNSPLKKATSMGDMNSSFSPRNSREMAAIEQRDIAERMVRQSSPLKDPAGSSRRATTQFDTNYLHSPNTLANARATRWTQERFPTRR